MRALRQALASPLGLTGLAIRLALLGYPGSYFLKDLFVPFLDHAVLFPAMNPWRAMAPHFFPYGSVLLLILWLPRFVAYHLLGTAALGTGLLGIALVKAPLLALDVSLWLALRRLAASSVRSVDLFYWLNPIAIYITYVHGQLDVASTAFCFLAFYAATRRHVALSALLFAAATLCKFHVIVAIPFLLAYFWNGRFFPVNLRAVAAWVAIYLPLVVVGFLPHIFSGAAEYASVGSPEAARLFSLHVIFGDQRILYLGLLAFALVVGRLVISSRITALGLFWGAGAIFAALVLVTDPMPGWYFWFLPYFALFFAVYQNMPRVLHWSLCALYLICFAVSPQGLFGNLTLTLMQALLAGNLVALWISGVTREAVMQGRTRSLAIGLAGDSGSGKNYLTAVLLDLFGAADTTVVEGDDYHKWERFHERWQDYSHLSPRANHLSRMARHTEQLTQGRLVEQARYDHTHGIFTTPQHTRPRRTLVVQGLHTLYLRRLREQLDLKIFLDPTPELRLAWKIGRDVAERNHTPEKVLESFQKRQGDSDQHIAPQRQFADLVVSFRPAEKYTKERAIAGEIPPLSLHLSFWNDALVEDLLEALAGLPGISLEVMVDGSQLDRVGLTLVGSPSQAEVETVAARVFPELRHIVRARGAPRWRGGLDGLCQLFLVGLLQSRRVD